MLSGMSPLRYRFVALLLISCSLVCPSATNAKGEAESRFWNQPVNPFRIIGNIYYGRAFDVPHDMFFSLEEQSQQLAERKQANPFIDPQGYRTYLKESETEFTTQQANPHPEDDSLRPCWQPERGHLMDVAERRHYTLRRVEFLGLTYTPDEKIRNQMRDFNEGDIFTRAKLSASLKKISRFRNEIYPVRMTDLKVALNEAEKTVDLSICFRSKRR